MAKKIKIGLKKAKEKIRLFGTETGVYSASVESGLPHIHLVGNKQVVVEDCVGVIEYNETLVRLNLGRGMVVFSGKDLKLGTLDQRQLEIYGSIQTVEFCV